MEVGGLQHVAKPQMNPNFCTKNSSSVSGFPKAAAAWVDLIPFSGVNGGVGDDSGGVGYKPFSAMLLPGKPYTVGRSESVADFVFDEPRVSKQHCQILFDGFLKKLYLLNGALLINCTHAVRSDCSCGSVDSINRVVNEFRNRIERKGKVDSCSSSCRYVYKGSLNGLFVNGVRVSEGLAVELCVGDEVLLVCANRKSVCGGLTSRIGFGVRGVVFHEEIVEPGCERLSFERARLVRKVLGGKVTKRVLAFRVSDSESLSSEWREVIGRAKSLSARCNYIASSNDPISCIRRLKDFQSCMNESDSKLMKRKVRSFELNDIFYSPRKSVPQDNVALLRRDVASVVVNVEKSSAALVQSTNIAVSSAGVVPLLPSAESVCAEDSNQRKVCSFQKNDNVDTLRESVPQNNVAAWRQLIQETLVTDDVGSARDSVVQSAPVRVSCEAMVPFDVACPEGCAGASLAGIIDNKSSKLIYLDGNCSLQSESASHKQCPKTISPPGKNFNLNRLEGIPECSSGQENVVSLPELLHPVDSISRMFIATLTCDIRWFMSYCDIPSHLPITVAYHNSERCWSADPGNRSCVPDPDFPNLVAVYPPFPVSIAFGMDQRKKGVGCHHPKLLVLLREDSVRVIITSANLVPKQWKNVTNTVWWQDFPRRISPDYISLFDQMSEDDIKSHSTSDFAAQLAGFMASLIADVPSQAYWIIELTKYDFTWADVYLVASVPGVHSYRSMSAASPIYKSKSSERLLGSVAASVVGIRHRFQRGADSNGVQLRKLAAYLGHSSNLRCGISEVVLRREKNVPQDTNAVSVHVPKPREFCDGECVQLGFLPRTVAKWVSPLWDIGFFSFHGYVYPQEALTAASGESNTRVQLILCVSQGPNIQRIMKMMEPDHVLAYCILIASLQRCTGLWRLEEVLSQYKWPEYLESDFVYGSSSIGGSVGAQFLAAFSAAAGKRSQQAYDSEESDPEWGCWTAAHEMKHPSIRIIFPTIERVKSSHCGIWPSKHILSFTEKTWQKLKTADILYDAIPQPSTRVGHPMHVKVARRRFQSKTAKSSFGWVYCGSHNMSAAAWGQVISTRSEGPESGNSSCSRLRVCNYELGIISVFPPPEMNDSSVVNPSNLDDINLPFVVPAPKYGPGDKPATMRAMWEALAEVAEKQGNVCSNLEAEEAIADEDFDEEGEAVNYVVQEAEEEKAYADVLWHQVDSSQSS